MTWDVAWQVPMVVIGVANLAIAGVLFARSIVRGRGDPANAQYLRWLRVGGLVFVGVALYRTVFVSSYTGRLAWFDTIWNSSFVVRCLAFFAELSFIGLIAAVLHHLLADMASASRDAVGDEAPAPRPFTPLVRRLPWVAVGCIALAQPFAFTGLITQYAWPFAIEETLWALAFFAVGAVVVAALRRPRAAQVGYRGFVTMMAVWCAGYLAFQCLYALPFMYYAPIAGDAAITVSPDALRQAILSYTVTRDWTAWGGIGFIIWHSGYFSLCSWMCLVMMATPRRGGRAADARRAGQAVRA